MNLKHLCIIALLPYGADIDARFGELTDTCKACHRPFRK